MSTITGGSRTVYYGPNASRYVAAETLSSGTTVTALSKEIYSTYSENGTTTSETWVFIEWTDGSQKKRGYVKNDWINMTETVSTKSPYADSYSGARWGGTSASSHTVYRGPDSASSSNNTQYSSAGSISQKEQVTYLGEKPNNWAFIEYNTSNGKMKRAYINANKLAGNISAVSISSPGTAYTRVSPLPSHVPYGGISVNQGFNDSTGGDLRGHLGYDLNVPGSLVKPLFEGTYVKSATTSANGKTTTLQHVINGETFYTTYCHLASFEKFAVGQKVFPTTVIGVEGSTGNVAKHLHLTLYTGSPNSNPYGYCHEDKDVPFDVVIKDGGSKAGYYYGWSNLYPRCGGVRFYDPYRVYTSGVSIITQMKSQP